MNTWRLMDGAAGRPGVGSSGTQPPTAPTAYSQNYVTGITWKYTTGTLWFQGYWWWVPTGGQTAAQKFCLYSMNIDGASSNTGTVVPASVVTSGPLSYTPVGSEVGGHWNWVPLPTPIPITQLWSYKAATGIACTGPGFPLTNNQFGASMPYAAGIVNGPITAFSDTGGSNPDPFGSFQFGYVAGVASSDPTVNFPGQGNQSFNGWLDIQVTDQPPPGATYRLFPSLEGFGGGHAMNYNIPQDATDGYVLATNNVYLSVACQLLKLWWYSPSGALVLPQRCAVFNFNTVSEVAGTDNASPTWLNEGGGAATAGGGWCYVNYAGAGIVLPAGPLIGAGVYSVGGSLWRGYSIPFWGTGGIAGPALNIGASGLSNGPMSAPSTASGTPPMGQYKGPSTGWGFPSQWDAPENDWMDMEVIPVSASGLAAAYGDYDRSSFKKSLIWR